MLRSRKQNWKVVLYQDNYNSQYSIMQKLMGFISDVVTIKHSVCTCIGLRTSMTRPYKNMHTSEQQT